jgi:xanthine dehydrogenase accessory factor
LEEGVAMEDLYRELLRLIEQGEAGALAIVTESRGSAPQVVGAKMLVAGGRVVAGTIGGGAIEHRVVSDLPDIIAAGAPKHLGYDLEKDLGMACGGQMSVYVEPLPRKWRLVIFGAGHIGRILTGFAKELGFHVLVVDSRAEFANRERLPAADEIWAEPYERAIARLEVRANDFIVIVTHGHVHDALVLEGVVQKPCSYVGMIGSRRKVSEVLQALAAKGVPKEKLDAVHSPIGIKIGGSSPAEIAVSISAELVQVRAGIGGAGAR